MTNLSEEIPDTVERWVAPEFCDFPEEQGSLLPQPAEVRGEESNLCAEWTAGYQAGLADGNLAALKNNQLEKDHTQKLIDQLSAIKQELEDAVLHDLVVAAMGLTRQILKRELHQDADFYLSQVKHLVSQEHNGHGKFEIRMNPADLELISNRISVSEIEKLPDIVADNSLPRGSCLLEKDDCFVNAGIQNLIDQLEAQSHLATLSDGQPL